MFLPTTGRLQVFVTSSARYLQISSMSLELISRQALEKEALKPSVVDLSL
ncbi:hypothetical protein J463_3012 [Acinetobacter baumannii 1043794]|nr:hypothetical protein J463_3012 [Acinetobacter baumannii 1043794]EXG93488.1 hypothetical protein J649_3617 [Acinetobacter baumannii 1064293_45]KCX13880.1 hypothetical protein J723_3864 [Acinetobacter sp. 1264765]KCX71030.1 hypothetical protein J560_3619 [Acinetobacter baumannii 855125]